MSMLERKIIAVVMLLTLLWGGGLFVFYMLGDSTMPERSALEAPDLVASNAPVVPPPVPVAGALAFPAAANVTPVAVDVDTRRKWLSSAGGAARNAGGMRYAWDSRYQDRTGQTLPPPAVPTTAPTTAPTLVTVHLTKASLRQALVAVANAARIKVSITPPGWLDGESDQPPIDLNADAQPLMEVVNELCGKSATVIYPPNTGRWWGEVVAPDPSTPVLHLEHQQAEESLGPWVISGPFSFEVQQIFHGASLDPTVNPTMAQVTLKVTQEPSVIVLGQAQQPTVTEAVDDKGHSLVSNVAAAPMPQHVLSFAQILARAVGAGGATPTAPPENWMGPQQGGITLQLQCPADFGHTLVKLSGSEKFLVQQKAARLEMTIASPPVGQDKTVDGISVTVDQWQVMSPRQVMFRLVIHRTNQDATQWGRLSASMRQLAPVVLDTSGTPLPAARVMNSDDGDTECSCQYMCIENGPMDENSRGRTPGKLLVDLPTSFITLDVPFGFENLPLP
jgi:hypothetical protein